jgi:hypothetical protein
MCLGICNQTHFVYVIQQVCAANDDVQTFAKTNPGAGCKWNALIA